MRKQSLGQATRLFAMAVLLALAAPAILAQQPSLKSTAPARFRSGDVPRPPLMTMTHTGGITLLDVKVTSTGFVEGVAVLDDAPPFTEALDEEIWLWRFDPALENGEPVPSHVLVAGLFRSPELVGGAPPSPRGPVAPVGPIPYPAEIVTPPFPPQSLFGGTVMLELDIDSEGAVSETRVVRGSDTFTDLSIEAAAQWRFQAARRGRESVPSRALVLFVFPQPTTIQKPRPSPRR